MNFLWVPKWLSEVADGLMGSIVIGIRTLSFSLATIIYRLIIDLYNFFEKLCTAILLSNDLLGELSRRIGLILGLIMFFNVVFAFVKMMIDPDTLEDKEKGAVAIIKKTLIVIGLLGISNFAFNTLYSIQRIVIKEHVISNLLLPYQIQSDSLQSFGNVLSEELMYSFYQIEDFTDMGVDSETNSAVVSCTNMVNAFRNQIINQGKFDLGNNCLNESVIAQVSTGGSAGVEEQEVFIVNYNWFLCIAVGAFVVYLLFMYCLKVGVRMIQLMVLEVISPMAIVSYLSPKKDGMYSKWTKIYFSTYIDVFIRVAIINFIIFLIAVVLAGDVENGFEFWNSIGNPTELKEVTFYKVVIILALLTFAKKAPELMKELIPASASKLGFGASMKDIVGLQKGAKIGGSILGGAVGGAAVGLLAGRPLGAIGGALKGGFSGINGKGVASTFNSAWKNQKDANKKIADVRANGGGWFGYQLAKMQQGVGMRTAHEVDETNIALAQQKVDMYNTASKEAESEALKNGSNYIGYSNTAGKDLSLSQLAKLKDDQTIGALEQEKYEKEYKQLLKSATMFNLDYGLSAEGNAQVNFDSSGDFVSLTGESGTVYKTIDDVNNITNKDAEIGTSNATIESNMKTLIGDAKGGRGKSGKAERNKNSAYITNTKLSASYQKNKANAGK